MQEEKSPYLLSDADSLRRIKFAQFRRQVPALILLALAIVLQRTFLNANLGSLPLILALIAVAWYLFVGFCHRYRQRIPQPPPLALVSPLQGKIKYIRGNGEITLVNIHKVLLDSVEIRCPHASCLLENGALMLSTPEGKMSFRFNFKRLDWFSHAEFATGNIIGMAYGTGSCTISFPGSPELLVQENSQIDAGEPLIKVFRAESPTGEADEESHPAAGEQTASQDAPEERDE